MLVLIKKTIKTLLVPLFFIFGIVVCLITISRNVNLGLSTLVFFIPQPNIWYKFHAYPFGKDFLDFIYMSVILGIFVQRKRFFITENTKWIIAAIFCSYIALWNSSMRFHLPMPFTGENILLFDWKNHVQMVFFYVLSTSVVRNESDQKTIMFLMITVVFLLAFRNFTGFSAGSSFQYDKRASGPFWRAGLGANVFGAFAVHYFAAFLGMFLMGLGRRWRIMLLVTIIFTLHPILFAYSRGAYLGFLGALLFYGIIKKRVLIVIVIVIVIAWQSLLPPSVVDRIAMTREETGSLESSAAHRIVLWELAVELFENNPVFGSGYGSFALSVPEGELTDTHNYYLKMLAEQGVIGLALFLIILYRAFRSGWRLSMSGQTAFQRGLGLGLSGCVVACVVTNMFGDRWSYFIAGSYFWILWGLVDKGFALNAVEDNVRTVDEVATEAEPVGALSLVKGNQA